MLKVIIFYFKEKFEDEKEDLGEKNGSSLFLPRTSTLNLGLGLF